jgi:hypothetical protein
MTGPLQMPDDLCGLAERLLVPVYGLPGQRPQTARLVVTVPEDQLVEVAVPPGRCEPTRAQARQVQPQGPGRASRARAEMFSPPDGLYCARLHARLSA